jgi:hypothetical protein
MSNDRGGRVSDESARDNRKVAPADEAGEDLHVHRPKPLSGLREIATEIGVIVLGIVIAIGGEQVVEAIHWNHKVAGAEAALREELAVDLSYAQEQQDLHPCADRYFDLLQSAIADNRPDIVRKLYEAGRPIDEHPWRVDSWNAALSGQVPDHLSPNRVVAYSLAFRFVSGERDSQWDMVDLYAQAMTGRFGLLHDPEVMYDQLKAVDRLRAKEAQRADITGAFLRSAREDLGITKTERRAAEFRQRVESCETRLKAIAAP